MDSLKRIAIIGAGCSGLAAIKSCKEVGIEPICFERSGDVGGLWKYREDDTEGLPSVMKSTIMNTSKEMNAFSDFPPPKDFPNFAHHTKMHGYLMAYAEHFDLLRHIRYYSDIIKIEPTKDYEDTGRWKILVKNSKTGVISEKEFDGVMVCIGHHVYPNVPTFPGQEKFNGIILHSHSLKSCEQFNLKKLVVVGLGNSGGDAAVDSSYFAEKVYLSTRTGAWVHARIGLNGRPYNLDFNRKSVLIKSLVPFDSMCDEIENNLNQRFDHEAYNLKPKYRVLNAHPVLNDFLPYCIVSGRVIVKGNIERFEENGVVFHGEEEVTEVDTVVLATGYLIKFPLLGDTIKIEDNYVEVYKYVIPPNLKHATLGLIGLAQPAGATAPLSEIESRWFLQVFTGKINLPSVPDMMKDIKAQHEHNAKILVEAPRHSIEVEWIPFMDEFATQMGAKPNFLKMALTDPKLFLACYFGPFMPYQYRLEGPHSWSGAKDTLLSYKERIFTPLNASNKIISKDVHRSNKTIRLLTLLFDMTEYVAYELSRLHQIASFAIFRPFNIGKTTILNLLKS